MTIIRSGSDHNNLLFNKILQLLCRIQDVLILKFLNIFILHYSIINIFFCFHFCLEKRMFKNSFNSVQFIKTFFDPNKPHLQIFLLTINRTQLPYPLLWLCSFMTDRLNGSKQTTIVIIITLLCLAKMRSAKWVLCECKGQNHD